MLNEDINILHSRNHFLKAVFVIEASDRSLQEYTKISLSIPFYNHKIKIRDFVIAYRFSKMLSAN